jgi:hypothetical protein
MSIANPHLTLQLGRAIAQAVSRWLPIAAVRVRSRVWSSGICGGQSGCGAGPPKKRDNYETAPPRQCNVLHGTIQKTVGRIRIQDVLQFGSMKL